MTGSVYVQGGFDTDYEGMSDSLRARIAAADYEHERQAQREEAARRARGEQAERDSIALSIRMAQDRGEVVSIRGAYRDGGVGRTPGEAISYASAVADLEDAKQTARWRQALRKAGIDPDSGADLEVLQPPEMATEVAARTMPADADPAEVGQGVRARWLRREYRGME